MITPTVVSRGALHRTTTGEPTVIHLGRLRSVLWRGLVLAAEVVVLPGVVLYSFVSAGHPMAGLLAVLVARSGCIGGRLGTRSRVPATCWFAFALFAARSVAGLAVSSVSLYLLIPVLLCAAQGVFFLSSALSRRPLLMRLATDYTDDIPDAPPLRRLFAQLSALWGSVHLACAGVGIWALTLSTSHAVAFTSALSLACTLGSAGGCIAWGLWRCARIPGLRIVCRERPSSTPATADGRTLADAA